MAKSNRENKRKAKEIRRRAELERQAKAHEKRMEEEHLDPKQKHHFKSRHFTIDVNNCDLLEALEEKLSHPYDVWAALYTTKSGNCIPYMFFADNKVQGRQTYLNRNRSKVFSYIEETYSALDIPDEDVCVVAMTNPPDGHEYGAIYIDSKAFLDIGKIAGLKSETEAYVNLAQLGNNVTVLINCGAA